MFFATWSNNLNPVKLLHRMFRTYQMSVYQTPREFDTSLPGRSCGPVELPWRALAGGRKHAVTPIIGATLVSGDHGHLPVRTKGPVQNEQPHIAERLAIDCYARPRSRRRSARNSSSASCSARRR